jgi:archaemetzincin
VVPTRLFAWLRRRVPEILGRDVAVGAPVPLPEQGYNARREQYRGNEILDALHGVEAPDAARVLGLIDADCYSPRLNFVFGVAELKGGRAFVALPRLRPSYYGLPPNPRRFRERVLKEVVHELGHTWGLRHCSNRRCVMHFSNSLRDTDVKGADFCARCRARCWARYREA